MDLKKAYTEAHYKLVGHGNPPTNILVEALLAKDNVVVRDYYGNGLVINDFEDKMAAVL